jgi:predicted transcriptional regulator of viral defense system
MKFSKHFTEEFSKKPAFGIDEVKAFIRRRNASEGYHKLLIQNMLKSGRIHKITRGAYTFYDEAQYVGFAFQPFYYGLEDAISLHGLWDQETNPVIITPRKVRNGIRQFDSRNYLVRRIKRTMFFGYSLLKYEQFYIPVSDIEKTLIDLAYFEIRVPDEIISNMIEKLNKEIFNRYLAEIPQYLSNRMRIIVRKKKW